MRTDTQQLSQYTIGFVSALVLLAGVALLAQAAAWVGSQPQPQAFWAFLNTPRFSLMDVFWGLVIVMLLTLMRIALSVMPSHFR